MISLFLENINIPIQLFLYPQDDSVSSFGIQAKELPHLVCKNAFD